MTQGRLYHLALEELHTSSGARLAGWNGWLMPADYGDARAEHAALRAAAAIADRSDRSRFIVSGPDALAVLTAGLAGHVDELDEGRAMRTVRLDGDGFIRDLLLVARTGAIGYVVSGEPGQREETRAALEAAIQADFDARLDDRTETTCTLALIGPEAAAVASAHLSEALPPRLPALHVAAFEFHGFRATAVRTSDTGEDGFEFTLAPAVAMHLIETLKDEGVQLAGTTAQDAARVEACIPAFAPDLETGLTPAQADIDVLFDVPGGAEGRTLAALLLESDEPAAVGTPVVREGEVVGEVRSCVAAYTLDAVAALAVIDQRFALPGTALDAGGRRATVVAKPFYRRR